jgi:hypothetical protein
MIDKYDDRGLNFDPSMYNAIWDKKIHSETISINGFQPDMQVCTIFEVYSFSFFGFSPLILI